MSDEQKYTIQGLDEYIRQGEPQQRERFLEQMKKARAEFAEKTGQAVSIRPTVIPKQQQSARIYSIDGTPATSATRGIVIEEGKKTIKN